MIPPIDALMQNTIRINRSSTADGIELYTTLAHEGYPGHLYQTVYSSLVCDTQTLPIRQAVLLRRICGGLGVLYRTDFL